MQPHSRCLWLLILFAAATATEYAAAHGRSRHTQFYELLGVDAAASAQDIKKGFRKQSMKWHPDKNPTQSAKAQEKFVEIGRAYEVLSDPQLKRRYDRLGPQGISNQQHNFHHQQQGARRPPHYERRPRVVKRRCDKVDDGRTIALACDHHNSTIREVVFASYGAPAGTCDGGQWGKSNFAKRSCHAPESQAKFEAACLGKNSCQVKADRTVFPLETVSCDGVTLRQLAVEVLCTPPPPPVPDAGSVSDSCATIPENRLMEIGCQAFGPESTIEGVIFADWGTVSGTCFGQTDAAAQRTNAARGKGAGSLRSGSCRSPKVLMEKLVMEKCGGRKSCRLPSSRCAYFLYVYLLCLFICDIVTRGASGLHSGTHALVWASDWEWLCGAQERQVTRMIPTSAKGHR